MHLLPDDFDLSFLVNSELHQICIGQSQIQFNFEDTSIEGFGKIQIEQPNKSSLLIDETWISTEGLGKIIGHPVVSWSKRNKKCFSIDWPNYSLVFHTEEGLYESFTIEHSNELLYVL